MYNKELFDPYHGFIRGTMFKEVYDHYGSIYEVKPVNEQAQLLTYIDICDFAMIDLGMYLDIYSEDEECIKIYNQFKKDKMEFVKKYENFYGALSMNSDNLDGVPWKWLNGPWPWEV